MITIQHAGDRWKIIGEGALRNGKVYCHLASTTRFRQQKNGSNPVQISDWVDQEIILSAAMQAEEEKREAQ